MFFALTKLCLDNRVRDFRAKTDGYLGDIAG